MLSTLAIAIALHAAPVKDFFSWLTLHVLLLRELLMLIMKSKNKERPRSPMIADEF